MMMMMMMRRRGGSGDGERERERGDEREGWERDERARARARTCIGPSEFSTSARVWRISTADAYLRNVSSVCCLNVVLSS